MKKLSNGMLAVNQHEHNVLEGIKDHPHSEHSQSSAPSTELDAMERKMIQWRSLAQEMTPGGSEFMDIEYVRAYYRSFKDDTHRVKIENVKLRRIQSLLLEACKNYDGAVIEVINAVNDGDLGLIVKATNKLRNEVVKSRAAITAAQGNSGSGDLKLKNTLVNIMKKKTTPSITKGDKLKKIGIYEEIMWHEKYREDYEGHFDAEKARLETEDFEQIFDRWCRGENLIGYSELIPRRVDQLRNLFKS